METFSVGLSRQVANKWENWISRIKICIKNINFEVFSDNIPTKCKSIVATALNYLGIKLISLVSDEEKLFCDKLWQKLVSSSLTEELKSNLNVYFEGYQIG